MAKLQNKFDMSNLNASKPDDVLKHTALSINDIQDALGGKISFADNFDAKILSVSFASANSNVSINHNLNRIPSGYIVLRSNVATQVYDGSVAWTKTTITLRASVAATVSLMVF